MQTPFLVIAILVAAAGCDKSSSSGGGATAAINARCTTFAERALACGKEKGDDPAKTKVLFQGMCAGTSIILAKQKDDAMALHIQDQVECAVKHADCAGYQACVDVVRAKADERQAKDEPEEEAGETTDGESE